MAIKYAIHECSPTAIGWVKISQVGTKVRNTLCEGPMKLTCIGWMFFNDITDKHTVQQVIHAPLTHLTGVLKNIGKSVPIWSVD